MKRLLIAVLAAVLLTACGAPAPIEGKWKASDAEGTTALWEFKDGTATVLAGDTAVVSGPYVFADGVLTVTFAEWAEPSSFDCKVTSKKLTLTQEGVEDQLVFVRVEE